MLLADNFTNVYPVSKTLRFELRPVGRTQEYIERDGVIDTDVVRAENYSTVKKLIDEYHKSFIEASLKSIELKDLDEFYALYVKTKRTEAEEKLFQKLQERLRKQIAAALKKSPAFKTIFKKELIKNDLLEFLKGREQDTALVASFSDFTTYFTGFNQNRENMYSDEAKSTAIGYRVIHQNLPKYLDNMKVFSQIMNEDLMDSLMSLESEIETKYGKVSLHDYFELSGFNLVISQSGIDFYNTILGGFTRDNGVKVQGLNEYINLYNQAHGTKLPKFKPLFKQILSDRESFSFIPEQFATDEEVFLAIDQALSELEALVSSEEITVEQLLQLIQDYDTSKIYIRNDVSLTTISQQLFGDWSTIKGVISKRYDQENPAGKMKPEKYDEKKRKVLNGITNYSIAFLNECLLEYGFNLNIESYFSSLIGETLSAITEAIKTYQAINFEQYQQNYLLKKNEKDISIIKQMLDSYKELQKLIKPLISGLDETDKDEFFYAELLRIWTLLDLITPLYNKVRNYVTGKPYSIEKVKLNFNKSTLLDGWDKNKERDNLGVLFLKDGMYYLGIMNRNNTKCLESAPEATSVSRYQKMDYKLLPGPNKMLPKVFFADSNYDQFMPSEELLQKYRKGTHKKGDDFNLTDCRNLIDYFKSSISIHEDWSKFGFQFSDTSTYQDISGFYREVEHQGYKITFTEIDESYIDSLVDEGSLYLFQIYNKDFSPYSKGTPNLHTLYWRALFSPENLADVVYKLNGGAEVFFRKASIRLDQMTVHPANETLQNKDPLNRKATSLFTYDIIKDRRYTCDKYQFHVPITINFKAPGENRMNSRVNRQLRTAQDLHIIGIDRGERNLLYISVIDLDGNIVEQMSLNQIISYDKEQQAHVRDFQQLLVKREKENIRSRQNWTTIGSIKEMKEGYLSQVIHVLTQLMIKYNAIIVLEDLNFGFKQGRQKFERQVYQKFEKMLIDKLNLYVDKQKSGDEAGGVLHPYQLTAPFESFQKLGKQTGFLYYVPAWNTSKIDPTTGFVNLFYTKYESVEKSRAFVKAMNRISLDKKTGCYAFDIDYSKFTYKADGTQTKWILYTYGTRIDHFRNPEKNSEWDTRYVNLTEQFTALFKAYDIAVDGTDLRSAICTVDSADFYRSFMKLFSLMVQMRNSDEEAGIDQVISPVMNEHGQFFVSGLDSKLPSDADANGAYNIAKKGLFLVKKIQECDPAGLDKVKLAISNKEWLKFAQEYKL